MKALAKKLARMVLGEYSAYYVYAQSAQGAKHAATQTTSTFSVRKVDASMIHSHADAMIKEQADYAGLEAHAYACFYDNRIVGICFYWFGNRYLQRNFWPLTHGEAKLVQIISLPEMRGRGVATTLVTLSCRDMMQQGFHQTYARVWHSNTPSLRAFERAGWRRIALVIEINPLRRSRPIQFRFHSKSAGNRI